MVCCRTLPIRHKALNAIISTTNPQNSDLTFLHREFKFCYHWQTLAHLSYNPQNQHCIFLGCISCFRKVWEQLPWSIWAHAPVGLILLHSHYGSLPLLGTKFSSLFRRDLSSRGASDSFPLGSSIWCRGLFLYTYEHMLISADRMIGGKEEILVYKFLSTMTL